MRIGESLKTMLGVESAGVVMATPANLEALHDRGLDFDDAIHPDPEDILIVVSATDDVAATAALDAGQRLIAEPAMPHPSGLATFPTTSSALRSAPPGSIGLVSVPGEHAPRETRELIENGHTVVMFSDNVSLEDEFALKALAADNKAALLGPDCGTTSIAGVGLGFVNQTEPGPVGIVAASGTGAQAIAVALDRHGCGISHIVGVGGRDLTDEIGGSSLFGGLAALDGDQCTKVIVVVAKQIGRATLSRLVRTISSMRTPVVTCIFGQPDAWITSLIGAHSTNSLGETAATAKALIEAPTTSTTAVDLTAIDSYRRRLGADFAIRGAFAGGTLAYETARVLRPLIGQVSTNVGGLNASAHAIVDLGEDQYTRGQPHPMINPHQQADFLRTELDRTSTGIVMMDIVLGYGCHASPAEILVKAITESRSSQHQFAAIATVIGTAADSQDVIYQSEILADAGVIVFEDTSIAALFAGLIAAPALPTAPTQVVDLTRPTAVINVGTRWFAEAIDAQGGQTLHVDWHPPSQGDPELADALDTLS
jgi:FdrA protein